MRDLGRDPRVPVAVRADPRAEPQHGRHQGRSGARAACIGRERGPGRRFAASDGGQDHRPGVEGPVRRALEARDDGEQDLVEDRERGPDLVKRGRGDRAQVRGVPQERDLLAEPAADVGVFVRRDQRVVERVEQPADPALCDEQRPAACLGGVGGQHRVDHRAPEQRLHLRLPMVGAEHVHGLAQRFVDAPAAGPPGARAQRADALALLGEVDELEVQREGLGDRGRAREVEGADLGREPRALGLARFGRTDLVAPQRDGQAADALDGREQVRARLLGDDLAEQGAQQPDLARHGIARTTEPGARRLRGNRGEPGLRGARVAGPRCAGGSRRHDAQDRRPAPAFQPPLGYGSTARAPSRYRVATDDGSGEA